jgi:hypothetical protein
MSDFWAKKLAQAGRKPPSPPAPAPTAQAKPWWMQVPVSPPTPQTQPQPDQFPQPVSEQEYRPAKAQHLKDVEFCPDCGRDTYMGVPGHPQYQKRCTACGYPIKHSTSDLSVPKDPTVPVAPARQVSTENNFSFNNVFARIGDRSQIS